MFGFWRKKRSPTLPIYREPVHRGGSEPHADPGPKPVLHAPTRPTSAVDDGDIGEGLREADLAALYGLAKINVLEAGAVLLGPEDRGGAVHMLVKGEVALQDATGKTLMQPAAGTWIGQLDAVESGTIGCSAVATGPASVLSLDRATYDGLDRELKLRVLTQVQTHQHAAVRALAARIDELNARNRVLMDALYRSRQTADADLSKTEPNGRCRSVEDRDGPADHSEGATPAGIDGHASGQALR